MKHEMGKRISEFFKVKYSLDMNNQKIFDYIQRFDNDKKVDFIKESFITKFHPKFEEQIYGCLFVNEKNAVEGIFANEDTFHSILNFRGIQVVNTGFSSRIYTDKLRSKGKGRVDFSMKNNNTGLIIEVKYKGQAVEVLDPARLYGSLIEVNRINFLSGLISPNLKCKM